MASLHAQHQEEIAEALAEAKRQSNARHEQQMAKAKWESNARHEQQMAEAKQQLDEMMSGVRTMLQGFRPLIPASQIFQALKMLPLI